MRVEAVHVNLPVENIDDARGFYVDYLGLTSELMNQGWVARLASPETGAHVQLVTRDATAPEDAAASLSVDDVDEAYAQAIAAGFEIVHPLTDEPWGVRRFFVRAPGGAVLNILQHHAH